MYKTQNLVTKQLAWRQGVILHIQSLQHRPFFCRIRRILLFSVVSLSSLNGATHALSFMQHDSTRVTAPPCPTGNTTDLPSQTRRPALTCSTYNVVHLSDRRVPPKVGRSAALEDSVWQCSGWGCCIEQQQGQGRATVGGSRPIQAKTSLVILRERNFAMVTVTQWRRLINQCISNAKLKPWYLGFGES